VVVGQPLRVIRVTELVEGAHHPVDRRALVEPRCHPHVVLVPVGERVSRSVEPGSVPVYPDEPEQLLREAKLLFRIEGTGENARRRVDVRRPDLLDQRHELLA